ncbi:MAG: IS256 family transposase [Clostridiales bacterium]|nr:IS256 family transposase [Clostridiales bacterium]
MKPKSIIRVDEAAIQEELNEKIRLSVEETLNNLLDAEADQLCGAKRYERSEARKDTRAGHYERGLQTRVGQVSLKVPKLRKLPFETAIIERYRRREISVEEAMMEMYLAGVSVRRVEDITEALWGAKVSPGTVSNINQKLYERIHAWRNESLEAEYPYVYFDGICLKRSWAGEVTTVSVLVAIGVDREGYRKILGIVEGGKEDKAGWNMMMRHLKERGLKRIKLIISDKCIGLVESAEEHFPKAKWQRCVVHFYRNVFSVIPSGKVKPVSMLLKAIHAQECRESALIKARAVATQLKKMKLGKAAEMIENGIDETLTYMGFPLEHWTRIKTNNPLERLMREIRRRTRVVGCFPDGESALMLAAARLRHVAGTKWGMMRYLNMELFKRQELSFEKVLATA